MNLRSTNRSSKRNFPFGKDKRRAFTFTLASEFIYYFELVEPTWEYGFVDFAIGNTGFVPPSRKAIEVPLKVKSGTEVRTERILPR